MAISMAQLIAESGIDMTFQLRGDFPGDTLEAVAMQEARDEFNKHGEMQGRMLFLQVTRPTRATMVWRANPEYGRQAAIFPQITRAIAQVTGAYAAIMIAEVFTVTTESADGPQCEIRHHPERREQLLAFCERVGRVPPLTSWSASITRQSKTVTLAPWELVNYHEVSGRVPYILPPSAYGKPGKA